MAVNVVMLGLSLLYGLILASYGDPDWGPLYSGYVGLLLFSATLVALGPRPPMPCNLDNAPSV